MTLRCVVANNFDEFFYRKATRQMVDSWLISHAIPPSLWQDYGLASPTNGPSKSNSGSTTPVRKISAHEFERGGLLKPIVTTIDGTPTFLSPVINVDVVHNAPKVHRRSRMELKGNGHIYIRDGDI